MARKRNKGSARLILMRHAKSDRTEPAAADFDRPLAARGRRAVPAMAAWFRRQGFEPGRILSSPAARARETALLLAHELDVRKASVAFDEDIYEADLETLLRVIAGRDEPTLLLVGHNPGLDDLLCHLCSAPPPRDAEGKLLTTAAIAVLDFSGGIDTAAGSARLVTLRRPKDSE